MSDQKFPPGWDAESIKRLADRYESMSDDELAAKDEAVQEQSDQVVVVVPRDLLPAIRQLLASYKAS